MDDQNSYDFVVIGGGTSGLVRAARLSELPHARILILEAGESHIDDPRVKVPGLWHSMLGSEADWNFKTASQVRELSIFLCSTFKCVDLPLTYN